MMNTVLKNVIGLLLFFSFLPSPVHAGKITVNNGATLRGTGVIQGDIEVYNGGTVEPFTTCLSVSDAWFEAGSELKVSVAGNTACTNYSQLLVNGTVDLNNASLNATTSGYTMQVLDEYVFINNDLSDGIISPFDGISENSTYVIDGELLYASYFAGDGNDFSLLYNFSYPIGGTVTGLAAGNEVFLQINGEEIISINSNGTYQFPTQMNDNSAYDVQVINQPTSPNQTCTVSNGSGSVTGGAVTDINVNCQTNTYTVGGNVIGLAAGNQVVIQNNGADELILNSNSGFVFPVALTDESAYDVQVTLNPSAPNQTCVVTNGTGNLTGANVTDVIISCITNTYSIGGTVSGLAGGNTLTLQNNLTDDLLVSANGAFTFATQLADQSSYTVTVLNQPETPNQTCTVTNNSGVLNGANQTDILINCVVNDYFIGGSISGLAPGNMVTLQNNGTDDLLVSDNGVFVFNTPLADNSAFSVTVLSNPSNPNQSCEVTNGTGTVAGDDVVGVSVDCTTDSYMVGGTLTGLLAGEMLVLQNNGQDDLVLLADGVFVFNQPIEDLGSYSVTVLSQPTGPIQNCSVEFGSGQIAGQDVTDISVTCDNLDLIYRDGFEFNAINIDQSD